MNMNKCRFCLIDCERKGQVNIFDRNYNFVLLLIEKVLHYFPYMEDGLSKIICNVCLAKMDKINHFLQTSIKYLVASVNVNSVKPCNLCGRVWERKLNADHDITSKLTDLFGHSIPIAQLSSVCVICVSQVHVHYEFIKMVESTLSSSFGAEEHTTSGSNEISSMKLEVDDVEPHANVSKLNVNVKIKEEVITEEIKQEFVDTDLVSETTLSAISIKTESVNIITSIDSVENSKIHPREAEIDAKAGSSQKDHTPKAQKPSRTRKVVNYFEDELSNPDSPDSSVSLRSFDSNSDSEIDSAGSNDQTIRSNFVQSTITVDKATPIPPKNHLVNDLRKFRSLQLPPPKKAIADKPPRRIVINKGEETKPSLNLIFTKKKLSNSNKVIDVSVRSEYIENIKFIKPLLGDGFYYTLNDKIRCSDQVKYKDFVIKCIEYILQGQANLMPYLTITNLQGVKRLMFTCFICGTVIHNNMIRQAINAHLIMHMVMLCPMCGILKPSISDMNHHLKTHSKSIYNCKYECRMCSKEITTGPEIYFTHVMSHFELFNCVECSYSTNEIERFINHHDNVCGRGDCKGDCSARYKTLTELMQHLDTLGMGEVGGTSYVCSNCKIVFHSKELASIHFDIHGHQHSHIERLRPIKEETQSFIENAAMLRRYETSRDYNDLEVDDENNCTCPFCLKCLKNSTSAYLDKHINLHILLACRACDNSPIYKEFIAYKNHVLFEHTLVVIECKLCENVKFHNVDLFLSHILQHI